MSGRCFDLRIPVLKLLVLFSALLLPLACSYTSSAGSGPDLVPREDVRSVRVAPVSRSTMEDVLSLSGEVSATGQVYVVPDTHGLLTKVLVSPGDKVGYDQVIAYVDPSRPGMSYAESPVRSKAAGTVTAVPAVPGNQVSMQTVIAHVGNLKSLEVEVKVPEKYLAWLERGMPGRVVSRSHPELSQTARVSEISPVVDPRSRTVRVMLIPDSTASLRPGQAVSVDLVLDSRSSALVIPAGALTERREGEGVFTVRGSSVVWQKVETGARSGGYVEILSGLNPGDTVVSAGQEELTDGSRIRILES